jgi:hypothetical protein
MPDLSFMVTPKYSPGNIKPDKMVPGVQESKSAEAALDYAFD